MASPYRARVFAYRGLWSYAITDHGVLVKVSGWYATWAGAVDGAYQELGGIRTRYMMHTVGG